MAAQQFQATNYAICTDGHLMPCKRIGRDEDGLIEVTSPGGMVYSYPQEQILSEEDGRQLLQERKAERVARDYSFTVVFESAASIAVRCQRGRSKTSDYLIIIGRAEMRCNCPSWSQETGCKHVGGLLLDCRQNEYELKPLAQQGPAMPAGWDPFADTPEETVDDKIAASLAVQALTERAEREASGTPYMEIAAEDW